MFRMKYYPTQMVRLFLFALINAGIFQASNATAEVAGFRSVRFVDGENGWLSGSRGIFCTRDGGQQWKRLSAVIENSLTAQKFQGNPLWGEPGRILWASRNRVLIRSEKGLLIGSCDENEWQEIHHPIYEKLRRVVFSAFERGWGITPSGELYQTQDHGHTWTTMTFIFSQSVIRDFEATSIDELWAIDVGGSVFHTTDGGKNWDRKELGDGKDNMMLQSIHFFTRENGWIANTLGSLYRTTDRGRTWRRVLDSDVLSDTLIDLAFANDLDGWALAAWSQTDGVHRSLTEGMFLLRTADGGNKWVIQKRGIKDFLVDIEALPNGTVWVVGQEGTVLQSKNHGATWRRVKVK
jgi:photosystem II stability/assembly factor-like uncharacterized protein